MSPHEGNLRGCRVSFPRVSGDEPSASGLSRPPAVFSPRERG